MDLGSPLSPCGPGGPGKPIIRKEVIKRVVSFHIHHGLANSRTEKSSPIENV